MGAKIRIAKLENPIKDYAWGSKTAIPDLIGAPVSGTPQAEMWMGAHAAAPSRVIFGDKKIPLSEAINANPEGLLGPNVSRRFVGRLPFLFKILAAGEPLSIQVHPNSEQAHAGYCRENVQGIPLDARERCYKDDQHKPEIICALEPMWALKGFRPVQEILENFSCFALEILSNELSFLRQSPNSAGLRSFYTAIMEMSGEKKERCLMGAVEHAKRNHSQNNALDWLIRLDQKYPGDSGVLSPLYLNLVRLEPGQALYLPAGELHAYLEGMGVELMANSDNVLRGGLTPKHINIPELLSLLTFESGPASILQGNDIHSQEKSYPTSTREFRLSCLRLWKDAPYEKSGNHGIEILIVIQGQATIEDHEIGESISIRKGESLLVAGCVGYYRIQGNAVIYKASVPEEGD